MVTKNTEVAEVLNAFFISVFTKKTFLQDSQISETSGKVWSREN